MAQPSYMNHVKESQLSKSRHIYLSSCSLMKTLPLQTRPPFQLKLRPTQISSHMTSYSRYLLSLSLILWFFDKKTLSRSYITFCCHFCSSLYGNPLQLSDLYIFYIFVVLNFFIQVKTSQAGKIKVIKTSTDSKHPIEYI